MNDLTHRQSFTAPKVRRAGVARRAMKTGKRWLFYTHRWLGVTACVLSVMWFLSGLVMLYVPFPLWSDEQRWRWERAPIAGCSISRTTTTCRFCYGNQPARDILMWLLSIAGLIISVSGVVVGWRTLARRKFP